MNNKYLRAFLLLLAFGIVTGARADNIAAKVPPGGIRAASKYGDTTSTCDGDGRCLYSVIHLYSGGMLEDREVVMDFTLKGNYLTAEFRTVAPKKTNFYNVSRAYTLDNAMSKLLGCKSITILPKKYVVDCSKNRLGTVVFDVRRID